MCYVFRLRSLRRVLIFILNKTTVKEAHFARSALSRSAVRGASSFIHAVYSYWSFSNSQEDSFE